MLLGILSDSHDNLPNVSRAVALFNDAGVDHVLHCGDFVAPFALLPFRELACKKLTAVFGNNDGEHAGLSKIANDNGWQIAHGPHRLTLGGRNIVMVHEPEKLDKLLSEGGIDLALFGHLHKKSSAVKNGVLLLNPGEAGGWLTGEPSVVTIDTETLEPNFHSLI